MVSDAATSPPHTSIGGRFVGQSVRRKEDRRLLTGSGEYVDDVTFVGTLHAAFLRSDVAKARIVHLDVSAAAALPGVQAIFTGSDLVPLQGEAWNAMIDNPGEWPMRCLVDGDVRFVGDPIAVVIASSRALAEDACDLIDVELDAQDPCVDYRSAATDDRLVHAEHTSNLMRHAEFSSSDEIEQVFASATHITEVTIEQNRYNCIPVETRGVLASWHPGREEMDIVMSTQSAHESRNYFSRFLQIPDTSIRVRARDVGGGFGQKMFPGREESAVVLSSKLLGRPVKWIEDRRENLIAATHSRNEAGTVRLAFDADHQITAMAIQHVADVGAYVIAPATMNPTLFTGPYAVAHLRYSSDHVFTNTMGKGAYRGPWLFETTAREMVLDIAARELGVDPLELRRRNVLQPDQLPFTNPAQQVFDEITPAATLEQAAAMIDYTGFRAEQASWREDGRWLGLGISCYIEPTSMASTTLLSEGATVRVEASGRVSLYMGTTSHGQSVETTMAQLVADNLGVDIDQVVVVQGDSGTTPYGPGTAGSRTAVVAGGAARAAALAVREQALQLAADHLEASPDDLDIEDGRIFVRGTPTKSVLLSELAHLNYIDRLGMALAEGANLEATVRFRPSRFPTYSNATHMCIVEVDPTLLTVQILRYVVSEDCGRMINPMVVEGQIYGGVLQGVGGALMENFVYDEDGNPLTTTFMDYLMPTSVELPMIEVGHIESSSTSNPGGFKGIGEGGAIGSHAAVANAVADALAHLGVTVTRTPLGPSELLDLLGDAAGESAGRNRS